MQILFVRHGQSTANTLQVFANRRVDDHPLTPLGQRQADELARQLGPEPLSCVYTSPLLRAQQTAATVAAARSLTLRVTAALREYDVGAFEDLPYGGIHAWRMAEYERNETHWRKGDADHRLAGGESLGELRARLHRFVRDLEIRHGSSEMVLLVGHGGLIRVALPGLLENVTLDISHGHPLDHGTIVRATLSDGRLACTLWGERRFEAAARCGG